MQGVLCLLRAWHRQHLECYQTVGLGLMELQLHHGRVAISHNNDTSASSSNFRVHRPATPIHIQI